MKSRGAPGLQGDFAKGGRTRPWKLPAASSYAEGGGFNGKTLYNHEIHENLRKKTPRTETLR